MSKPISDTKRMITVSAHGTMRLLNGFEARLRLLFTGETSLRAYRQAKLCESIHGLWKQSQTRRIYTHSDAIGFVKVFYKGAGLIAALVAVPPSSYNCP